MRVTQCDRCGKVSGRKYWSFEYGHYDMDTGKHDAKGRFELCDECYMGLAPEFARYRTKVMREQEEREERDYNTPEF